MTPDAQVDAELAAMQAVVGALEKLEPDARGRVVSYALSRFDIRTPGVASPSVGAPDQPVRVDMRAPVDVRSLKELKAPRSATEMAAVVAFYLSELAPEAERKDFVTTSDIRVYFKQAGFPLPKEPRYTLVNAKNSGYFDATSEQGVYRLNPVGYNLVAHVLPATSGGQPTKTKAKTRRKPGRR